ncbi:MAG: zinc ABC transporter substrate-binding protein, partial [Erysipelotrichaceae bacterium]|nr:zinc ABC transporter substrate-binding protein [Erysipelotrichaceae bacterium]
LERTTLFIYVGELEPYMDVFESEIMSYKFEIINLANLSAVNKFRRYTTVSVNNTTVTTESDYYNSNLFDMVDMYEKDPFIWLDPIAMASMASTIKDWLQSYYPEDSLIFENNFKTIQANMVRMDAEYQSLKNLNVKLATVGCTFGNWQKPYNVQVYPLVMSKYGVLPSDEQLAFIKKTIVENDVKFIVRDETLPEDMMALYEQVRDELKLKEISLSSLSRLSDEDKDKNKDYMTIMYDNLISLEEAFK